MTFLPRRMRTWTIVLLATIWLTVVWITIALAQAVDGDADSGDGDELSVLGLALSTGALALVGWLAYRRRSPRSP